MTTTNRPTPTPVPILPLDMERIVTDASREVLTEMMGKILQPAIIEAVSQKIGFAAALVISRRMELGKADR